MKPAPVRMRAASRAISELIDRFGARLVLESLAAHLRKHAGMDVWSDRFRNAAQEFQREEEPEECEES